MTTAEKYAFATLSYSRSQMIAASLYALPIVALAGPAVLFAIAYSMHSAAAVTVEARHALERQEIEAKLYGTAQQRDDRTRQIFRQAALWWSQGNPTSFRPTAARLNISPETWQSLRQMAVDSGLASWDDTPNGKSLRWTASQTETIKLTANMAATP